MISAFLLVAAAATSQQKHGAEITHMRRECSLRKMQGGRANPASLSPHEVTLRTFGPELWLTRRSRTRLGKERGPVKPAPRHSQERVARLPAVVREGLVGLTDANRPGFPGLFGCTLGNAQRLRRFAMANKAFALTTYSGRTLCSPQPSCGCLPSSSLRSRCC